MRGSGLTSHRPQVPVQPSPLPLFSSSWSPRTSSFPTSSGGSPSAQPVLLSLLLPNPLVYHFFHSLKRTTSFRTLSGLVTLVHLCQSSIHCPLGISELGPSLSPSKSFSTALDSGALRIPIETCADGLSSHVN